MPVTETAPEAVSDDLTARRAAPRIGDRVRIGRDEALFPGKGTWPRWRDRLGTVLHINRAGEYRIPEYGISFGKVRTREDGSLESSEDLVWFLRHELVVVKTADEQLQAA